MNPHILFQLALAASSYTIRPALGYPFGPRAAMPRQDLSPAAEIHTTLADPTRTPKLSETTSSMAQSNSNLKIVVAHHMVGNTYPYKLKDWEDDIRLAHASGIDGFALNMGQDEWQPTRIADAYEAARQTKLDFKLFISLDMASFPCATPDHAETLRNIVKRVTDHPNQYMRSGRAFVSTFAGESCDFGQVNVPEGWKSQFSRHPELSGKIYFVPSFFVAPKTFKDFNSVADGSFNWNSAWPIQVTKQFAEDAVQDFKRNPEEKVSLLGLNKQLQGLSSIEKALEESISSTLTESQRVLTRFIGSIDTDNEYREGLKDTEESTEQRTYMAAISPLFFTHYGATSFNKNFVYLSDQHLYARRWEALVEDRDNVDIVQIVTWNDYGESHYVGPIKGAQPNSEAWTSGMDHTGWLGLTDYYAKAFKTGSYPTIDRDKIFMWSRPHPSKAIASQDPVPKPTNSEVLEDNVWVVAMTTAPSNVTISVSSTDSKTFTVPQAGLWKLSLPILPGGFMKTVIQREGETVLELEPKKFHFEANPTMYNYNAFVAAATAP